MKKRGETNGAATNDTHNTQSTHNKHNTQPHAHDAGADRYNGPIQVAVVGLGRIGSMLEQDERREKPCTHVGAILANPECTLVAGADNDPERRLDFVERWDCLSVFTDVHSLLKAVKPDILCIATHPDSHAEIAAAAAPTVPVLVCEKPIAHTMLDARRIVQLTERYGTRIVVNHERRYSEDYREARRAVEDGRYGELLSIRCNLYFGRTTRLDRMLMHDGTHILDAAAFLAGKKLRRARLHGRLRARSGTAYVVASAGNADVLLEIGAGRDHLNFEIELSFERGRIRVGNGVREYWQSVESPHYEGYRSLVCTDATPLKETGYFRNMLQDAVRCFRDPDYQPVSSAKDARSSVNNILNLTRFRVSP